jgi:hypothetical protein
MIISNIGVVKSFALPLLSLTKTLLFSVYALLSLPTAKTHGPPSILLSLSALKNPQTLLHLHHA